LFTLIVSLSLFWPGSGVRAAGAYHLTIHTDRATAVYAKGEEARFVVRADRDGKSVESGTITYNVDDFITDHPANNDYPKGELELQDGVASIPVTCQRPLFLRCQVAFKTPDNETLHATAGVGFAPVEIQPSLPVPKDFDRFWAEQKRKLAEVPMAPKLLPVQQDHRWLECYDVQVDCLGGAPVSGYLALQHNAEPHSLPAVLWVHGAGVRGSSMANAITGARAGLLSMDINAHGIPNGKPAEYYQELARGRLKNYPLAGRESRDTSYFRGMFLRLVRAIDYLTSRPEWDGQTVMVIGHSQGGGQALVAGGLDPRVTFLAAGVPALCDPSGRVVDRINGWPKLVPLGENGKPDPRILEASRYVDAVNFASRCKAGAIMSVGFIDSVCPPASCYAAYNALQGKKKITHEVRMGHAAPARIQRLFLEQLLLHAKSHKAEKKLPVGAGTRGTDPAGKSS
jgi:cephalosporin-C deacetylase-like acetyl esterase